MLQCIHTGRVHEVHLGVAISLVFNSYVFFLVLWEALKLAFSHVKDFPKLPFGLLHYLASLHMFSFFNLLFSVDKVFDIHLLFNNQNVIHPGIIHNIICSCSLFWLQKLSG